MKLLVRLTPFLAAVTVALTLGGSGGAQPSPASGLAVILSFGSKPALAIEGPSASGGGIGAILSSNAPGPPPAQVVVDLPAGYTVGTPPPGAEVGIAFLTSSSSAGDTGGSTTLINAIMTVDDPTHYAADPAAQACAPGTAVAVWKVSTTILGLSYTLPIFIGHPAADPQGVELRFCPPPLTGPDGKPLPLPTVPLDSVALLSVPLTEPTAPGSYTSRAFITAAGPTGAPNPQTTMEARFLRPVPHVVTVKGRYDPKSKSAVLTGRVTELGKPEPYVPVDYAPAARSKSLTAILGPAKRVRASAQGVFTIRTRITKTTTFAVDAEGTTGACQGVSTAPFGCSSETVEGTSDKFVKVTVPKR